MKSEDPTLSSHCIKVKMVVIRNAKKKKNAYLNLRKPIISHKIRTILNFDVFFIYSLVNGILILTH